MDKRGKDQTEGNFLMDDQGGTGMKLFWAYLKQHGTGILAFALFSGIFALCFLLYRLPMETVAYPVFLCTLCGLAFLICDFLKVKRRHRALRKMQGMTAELILALPEASGIETRDYQTLIRRLLEENAALCQAFSARYQDMTEYYTVWVHQIKTPITSMKLSLETEDTPLSGKLSSDLRRIEQYVEMVLVFLRLDSDSSDYVFREYDLDEILKQSIAGLAADFIARRLTLDYQPVNLTVVTDEKWLSFVIGQILSNALKYTRKGSVKIFLQEPAVLCIEDTGIGIAPEDLPRVFEKGYTGYNGRRDMRASGIGLYLCKRICDKLGIGIQVESRLDQGTKVCLNLEQYDGRVE